MHQWLLVAVLCLGLAGVRSEVVDRDSNSSTPASDDLVCIVIRTFWGHGKTWGDNSLPTLLQSLQNQTHTKWEAMLLVLDNRPFADLRETVRNAHDDRVWVYAEWINYQYAPKDGEGSSSWSQGYHNKLYSLTDSAIRACPPETVWVVVTNGDNNYDASFLSELVSSPKDADAVAFDFYSRYQRPTGAPCDRFTAGPGLPLCKENAMRMCQTDLAAIAYRWPLWLAEGRRYGVLDPGGTSSANDGLMAQAVVAGGWKVRHVRDKCLVNHAPSPQQCAARGDVWDDSQFTDAQFFGGECLPRAVVTQKLHDYPTHLEMVTVNVSHQAGSFGFSEEALPLSCLRLSDRSRWVQAQVFGNTCAAAVDIPNLPEGLPPSVWHSNVQGLAQA
ncbi:MAG: hypothetical protein WDW38_002444 [Sanguina aurantia]